MWGRRTGKTEPLERECVHLPVPQLSLCVVELLPPETFFPPSEALLLGQRAVHLELALVVHQVAERVLLVRPVASDTVSSALAYSAGLSHQPPSPYDPQASISGTSRLFGASADQRRVDMWKRGGGGTHSRKDMSL